MAKTVKQVLFHIAALAGSLLMIYPLLWMVSSSLKETSTIFHTAESLIPRSFTFENYLNGWRGFTRVSFGTFFGNSLYVASLSTIGAVMSSSIVGYGFARCRFPMKKILFAAMLVSMMLPAQVLMIPQFIWFKQLGWVGTFLPLIVPYFFGQGFFIFLIVQFIQGIPMELDEAAKIDGCSYYSVFTHIQLPLIVPALITSAIFSFIWRWDDFLTPLLFLNKTHMYTVSIALKLFNDPASSSDYGAMFAMASLSILPAVIIFIFSQKYLVEGISTTGLKA